MRKFSSLKKPTLSSLLVLLSLVGSDTLNGAPVIPGLHRDHSLSDAQKGEILIEELRCASCHDGMGNAPSAMAPDLNEVGSRLNPEFLKQFIQNPSEHDAGTKMPDVLGKRSLEEREQLATSLSAYLRSLQKSPVTPASLPEGKAEEGKKLFHETGCVACHGPQDGNQAAMDLPGNIHLDHVGKKYQAVGLVSFLQAPLKVRPDGRMPDMKLSRNEAELLSAFLIGDETKKSEPTDAAATSAQISAGKEAFTELRCTACHQVEDTLAPLDVSAAPLPPTAELDFNQGCLSDAPESTNAPNYHLSDDQRSAIRSALQAPANEPSPAEAVKMRLTQLNCISCHERDDYGGVLPELDNYFHSTEEALGNHARIPPTLTLTGAKLRPEWMNKVLYEGESVRPYMTTRMPQFGTAALDGLTELFGKTDELEPFDYKPLDKESKPMMRNGAHMLLGDQGLNCIACHNYNGKESPSMKGLDLMTSYQRLQPAWFDQFMRNPAKFREGIIMPSYWPGGQAVQTEILDGNTEEQLRALWYNFSLGRSARDPSGLDVEDPELVVDASVLTYRGRSNVAGYRGIAVGYPGGVNYAFNAETGAFSAIWLGKFVTVGWTGQGSGNFQPAAAFIQLAEDLPFLSEPLNPWPLKPERTKESPVNPDPRYPRQYDYAFGGYSIAEDGIPTLNYRSGEVSIQERTEAIGQGESIMLRRKLSFNTEKPTTLYMRALTGDIKAISANAFQNSQLKLQFGSGSVRTNSEIRKAGSESKTDELILRLELPAGSSIQTIDYAPQR